MSDHDQVDGSVRVITAAGIAVVTIDHPPINLMTAGVFRQLARAGDELARDDGVRVVVLRSALPDFWIAHFDVEAITRMPTDGVPLPTEALNAFHGMCETFRTMPKITIAEIDGRLGGGGAELAGSVDLRYGSLERCVVSQPEVALGIVPGGSGTQRWAHLTNRSRAIEVICGGVDVDAATAERWGWLTRAMPAAELRSHVDAVARRIASMPVQAVARCKAAVDAALPDPAPGLRREAELFQHALRDPGTIPAMRRFLELGGQTPAGETDLQGLIDAMWGGAEHR